jgi:hypothetical protein
MQDAAEGLEDRGDSSGPLVTSRAATRRQQGMLRFSAHLALSLPALGLLPPPHDMSAGISFRDTQVRCY